MLQLVNIFFLRGQYRGVEKKGNLDVIGKKAEMNLYILHGLEVATQFLEFLQFCLICEI